VGGGAVDEVNGGLTGKRPNVLHPPLEAAGTPRPLAPLLDAVNTIERRLLQLIKESAQGDVALEDFVSELSLMTKDLERSYHQIADLSGRRDLSFDATATLGELEQRCVWLYRKICQEQAFFKKLHLEGKLRGLISAEAYEVYQELLNVDAEEREVLGKGSSEIRRLLSRDDLRLPWPELQ